MGGINVGRWLAGGVAAGLLMWLAEGLGSLVYAADMEAILAGYGMSMDVTARMLLLSLAVSLIAGLTLVFFYAAARPRFGPGPRTAVIVGLAYWIGGYVASLAGYELLGLFPTGMLALWGVIGLIHILLASLLGGWIYREAPAEEPQSPAAAAAM